MPGLILEDDETQNTPIASPIEDDTATGQVLVGHGAGLLGGGPKLGGGIGLGAGLLSGRRRRAAAVEKPVEEEGDFMRGIGQSFRGTKAAVHGATAFAQDAAGADSSAAMQRYEEAEAQVQKHAKPSDSFSQAWEEGDLIDWAQYGAGYVVGEAASMLATGGVGSFLAKTVTKGALKKGLEKSLSTAIEKKVAKGMTQEAAVRSTFGQLGAGVALGGVNLTKELGEIYPNAVEEAAANGEDPNMLRVFGAAVLAAGIETLTDKLNLDAAGAVLRGARRGGQSTLQNMAREAFVAGLREGGTELVQTGIERWGASQELSSPDAIRDYIDSAALGILGGGMLGTATGAVQRHETQTDPDAPPAETPLDPTTVPGYVPAQRIEVDDALREKYAADLETRGIDPTSVEGEEAIQRLEAIERVTGVIRTRDAERERAERQKEVEAAFGETATSGVGVGVGEAGTMVERDSVIPRFGARVLEPAGPDGMKPVKLPETSWRDDSVSTEAVAPEDVIARQEGWEVPEAFEVRGETGEPQTVANRFVSEGQAVRFARSYALKTGETQFKIRNAMRAKSEGGGRYWFIEERPLANENDELIVGMGTRADLAPKPKAPAPTQPAAAPVAPAAPAQEGQGPTPAPIAPQEPAPAAAAAPAPAAPAPTAPIAPAKPAGKRRLDAVEPTEEHGAQWLRMTPVEREATAAKAGLSPRVKGTSWEDLTGHHRKRLARAMDETGGVAPAAKNKENGGRENASQTPEVRDAHDRPYTDRDRKIVKSVEAELRKKFNRPNVVLDVAPAPEGDRGRAVRAAAEVASRVFGKRVILVKSSEPLFNGLHLRGRDADDVIFLDAENVQAPMSTVGHELLHTLRTKSPQAFIDLVAAAKDYLKQDGLARYKARLDRNYAAVGANKLPLDTVVEEMFADITGDLFSDSKFWDSFAKKNPSAFDRVITIVREFLDSLVQALTGQFKPRNTDQYLKSVEKMRDVVADAMARYSERETSGAVAQVAETSDGELLLQRAESKVKEKTPTVSKLLRNLTPEEQRKITDKTAAKIIEQMKALPSAKEMAAVAFAGRAKRGWYAQSAEAISHVFGFDAPRFAALLAAMSPQTSVEDNLLNALNTWKNWVKAGRPTDREAILDVMGASVQGSRGRDSILDAWVNNSIRALTSEDPGQLIISGPKVNSFFRNLVGVVEEVTNDAWMANYALVDQKIFAGSLNALGTDPGKGTGYLAMSARVREAAAQLTKLTGETWTPAEVQETVWSWAKTLYEMADAATESRSAKQLVLDKALTDELINATPDFGSLFYNPTYGQILEEAGYGEQLEGLRSAVGRAAARAVEEPAPGRQAAPFAEDDQRRHELRAADRLDRLRQQRRAADAPPVAVGRGVRGDAGAVALDSRPQPGDRGTDLEGLPAEVRVDGRLIRFGGFKPAQDAASAYAQKAGIDYVPPTTYAKVDPERAKRIAQAFDSMEHRPNDPEVKAAYRAMIDETAAQYEAILKTGLKVEFIEGEDPYGNPRNAILDVTRNNHLWVFPTTDGFGGSASADVDISGNPLLEPTKFKISGRTALANDIFRVVHDYFGHIANGVGFRADGEENAWRHHAAMYSPLARRAATVETRGQNSWVNFGPFAEANRTAGPADTQYAPQKIGLLPEWVSEEGREDSDLLLSIALPAPHPTPVTRPGWDEATIRALNDPFKAPAPAPIRQRLQGLRHDFLRRFVAAVVDPFVGLKELDDKLYMRARLTNATDGGLEALMHFGQVYDNGGALDVKRGTKGLVRALEPLGNEVEDFFRWVALNRAANLKKQDRENYFTDESIRLRGKLVEGQMADGRNRLQVYRQALADMNALNRSVLELAKGAGLIDQAAFDRFAADIWYVPFYRVAEEADNDVSAFQAAAGLSGQTFGERLKGGTDRVDALLPNLLRNWGGLLTAAQKNSVARDALATATQMGGAHEVPTGMAGAAHVMVNGKRKSYAIDDPMLANAVLSISMAQLKHPVLKGLNAFKRWLTSAVTFDPAFKIRNLMRDSIQAMAVGELPFNPIANIYNGVRGLQGEARASVLAGGGLFGHNMDERGLELKIKQLAAHGINPSTVLTDPTAIVRTALDGYARVGENLENANRVALYNSMIGKGKSHLEAAFAARDLMDFSLQGHSSAIRMLAMVLPFFNARLQGLYKLGRDGIVPTMLTIMGKGDEADRAKAARFSVVAGAVTMAGLLLYMHYKDDDEFRKREAWDRDNFWWFRVGDTAYRIPKPFELGAIGTLAERALEQLVDDEATGADFAKAVTDMLTNTFAFDPIPQAFRPLVNLVGNEDSFTDRPIESLGMQRLTKENRYSAGTSETAKALSKANAAVAGALGPIGEGKVLSPAQIDYLARGYFGWVGTMVMQSTGQLMRWNSDVAAPAARLDDFPLVGAFAKELPSSHSRYVSEFYRSASSIQEQWNDIKFYQRLGDYERARELMRERPEAVQLHSLYSRSVRQMAQLNQQMRRVEASETMTGEEKREALDKLAQRKADLAHRVELLRREKRLAKQ